MHSLSVKKEEQLILDDRASERSRPLIRDIEGSRISFRIVDPVVGIQYASIPVVRRIAVKRIASRFCDVVDVRPAAPPNCAEYPLLTILASCTSFCPSIIPRAPLLFVFT